MSFEIQDWGLIPYAEAWDLQKKCLERRITDEVPDQLIFCQHPPVITLGRGSIREPDNIAAKSKIPIIEVERGGLATYHGPGQIIAYPIFKLGRKTVEFAQGSRNGVHGLIRSLESWVIEFLQEFAIPATRVEGKTGVWINGERKIASIGIAARHWVSYHGIAVNLSTGREVWGELNPCGLGQEVMTDFYLESGHLLSYSDALNKLSLVASKHF